MHSHTVSADLANLELHYAPTPINIVNTGHSIQVNYAPGSYMRADGVRYDLVQFHFHSPSEHTMDGRHAEAEMHLVHKSADGTLAVIGVLFEAGVNSRSIEPLWRHLPSQPGPAQTFDEWINVADLLPKQLTTYRYMGSLTTPPGTEGVHWNLIIEPYFVSKTQIQELRAVMFGNNRPTQPINGRVVQKDTSL
jgi:carbonic anhydrase